MTYVAEYVERMDCLYQLTIVADGVSWWSLARPVQSKLEELEKELTVINENSERLKKSEAELVELQLVLEKAGYFFDEARASAQGTTYESSAFSNSPVDVPLLDDVPVRAVVSDRAQWFTRCRA